MWRPGGKKKCLSIMLLLLLLTHNVCKRRRPGASKKNSLRQNALLLPTPPEAATVRTSALACSMRGLLAFPAPTWERQAPRGCWVRSAVCSGERSGIRLLLSASLVNDEFMASSSAAYSASAPMCALLIGAVIAACDCFMVRGLVGRTGKVHGIKTKLENLKND